MSHESPRRYAALLRQTVEAYGAQTEYDAVHNAHAFEHVPREAPLHAVYALERLRDYIALMGVARSLVAPEDALGLARKWAKAKQRSVAQLAFESVAPGGDVQKLTPADTYTYSGCVEDPALRARVLRGLLGRDDPLPRPEPYIRAQLVSTYLRLERLPQAEIEMEALLDGPGPADVKYYMALRLARAFRADRDPTRAKHWAEVILKQFPDSKAAPHATRLLAETQHAPC
ncbi:MAG: hypothetical protein PVH68_17550 [Armatimonadota bacterium]|jgi:hypothetical protein